MLVDIMRIMVKLTNVSLWNEFHAYHNEMIITKAGRCLFPLLKIDFEALKEPSQAEEDEIPSFAGHPDAINSIVELDLGKNYDVLLKMKRIDVHKWKWRQQKWIPVMTLHIFPNPPSGDRVLTFAEKQSGAELLRNGLSFDKIKITNRDDGPLSFCLQSFCKYIPIIIITNAEDGRQEEIQFKETEFIAVTHYQNEQITLLKKSYNPHAKGFIINDGSGDGNSTPRKGHIDWLLTPNNTSSSTSSTIMSASPSPFIIGKKRRARSRIHPINVELMGKPSSLIPSDEEELQGTLALQFLSRRTCTRNNHEE